MRVYILGTRLKQLRESQGLSQEQLARYLGLTRSAISSYENNLSEPSADVFIKLAALYHVTVDYILGVEKERAFVVDGFSQRQVELIEKFIDYIIHECKEDKL